VNTRRAAAVVMVLSLVGYVALHTPLRGALAHLLGVSTRGCYLCARTVTSTDVAHAVAAAVLLLAALVAARVVAGRFIGGDGERVVVYALAATALLTVPAAILGGLASLVGGSFLRPPGGPLLASIPSLAILGAAIGRGWRPPPLPRPRLPATTLPRVGLLAAGVLVGASIVVSLLHPPTQGDALTYHAPIGVFLWLYGNLTTMLDRAPGNWVFSHPGTAELVFGLLRLIGGERLADLGQLPFALLGASAAYVFTLHTRLGRGSALVAGCAFLLMPLVALQVGTQANDVAAAAFLMAAIALAAAPVPDWDLPRVAAIGLALGLTAASKVALLPGVAAIGVIVLGALTRTRRRGPAMLVLFGTFLLVVLPWWARNFVREGNPIYPQAIPLIGHGVNVGALGAFDFEYVPRRIFWPLYPWLEPIDDRSGYGALFAVAVLPGLIACWRRGRGWPLGLWLASFLVTLPLWWKYTLHEPRFLLPYVGLAAAFVPWSLVAVGHQWRGRAAVILAAAAVFTVIAGFDQTILPIARLPVARAAFYDRLWAVDPVADGLPEHDGLLLVSGYGNGRVDYASTYPLLGPHQRRDLVLLDASDIRNPQTVRQRMLRAQVRYVYVTSVAHTRAAVRVLFAGPVFQLVHESAVAPGRLIGARRHLFEPVTTGSDAPGVIWRDLFVVR
jgi:hypothetical protein